MEYRSLGNTGLDVSVLSFGAASLGSVYRDIDESEGVRTVERALDLGINFIDVSPYYGLTKAETVLGRALAGIDRDRYFLATKAGRYGLDIDAFDFSAARIRASLEESLQRLGVDSIDLFQLHDIEFGSMTTIMEESIPTMQALKEEGKIRFWGLTGLPLGVFTHVLDYATPDTILSYCRYALNDDSLRALLPIFETRGVGVINASPTGMGLLTDRGAPDWHPASALIKQGCQRAAELCASRQVDITKLALQFATSNAAIATTLVGTASVTNIENNVRWVAEPMDLDLLAEVRQVLHPIQGMTWPEGRPENNLL